MIKRQKDIRNGFLFYSSLSCFTLTVDLLGLAGWYNHLRPGCAGRRVDLVGAGATAALEVGKRVGQRAAVSH